MKILFQLIIWTLIFWVITMGVQYYQIMESYRIAYWVRFDSEADTLNRCLQREPDDLCEAFLGQLSGISGMRYPKDWKF